MTGFQFSKARIEAKRVRATGLVALFFVIAQLLFAGHSDDLYAHAPQACEFCLAAAVTDDPNDLVFTFAPPRFEVSSAAEFFCEDAPSVDSFCAASPRGPPTL